MTKTVLTPHFDLLNATMIELYIVIKANTKILTCLFCFGFFFSVCFDVAEVLLQTCWNCEAQGLYICSQLPVSYWGCPVKLPALRKFSLLQSLIQSFFKWKESEKDKAWFWALSALGSENSTWEPRVNQTGTGVNWTSQESFRFFSIHLFV